MVLAPLEGTKRGGEAVLRRSLCRMLLAWVLAAAAVAAHAQDGSRIRLMLHPGAAAPGALPLSSLMRLQALSGAPLTLSGTTRTGALEFTLDAALSGNELNALLRRLREDRSVLWAEAAQSAMTARALMPSRLTGRNLMVRLAGDAAPDWSVLLPRFTDLAGMPLSVERQIGNVWVLSLPESIPEDMLAGMAEQLQQDSAVQYADPARRAFARRIPIDQLYSQQWSLNDAIGGINATAAW